MSVTGVNSLIRRLRRLPQDLERQIDVVIESNTREMARSAQRFAPVDTGELRASIFAARNGDLSWRVVVGANHGPYIEFGTGGLVRVPDELREIASRFIGSGTRQIDLRPQPYLFPALELQRNILLNDLRALLERELRRI